MSRITELLPPDPSPVDQAAELRPCPFCGGKAELSSIDGEHLIGCVDANCQVYAVTGPFPTAAAAIQAWNHRGGWKP